MNRHRNFWVVGGDMRQAHLAQLLAGDGHAVHTYALDQGCHAAPKAQAAPSLDAIAQADCVILPLPVCSTAGVLSTPLCDRELPLTHLLSALSPDQIICGGRPDPDTAQAFTHRGLTVHDYFQREELTIANAIPTAEGAVQIAMEELPVTIHNCRVLIIGYGRVGTLTAHRFAALGAKVSVAARSCEQLAWAQAANMDPVPLHTLSGRLPQYDLIINTVPARMLGRSGLAAVKEHALVIDLASRPGGVDMDAAAQLGVHVIWALSLPGKVAPVTAGAFIRDTVYNILHQAEN